MSIVRIILMNFLFVISAWAANHDDDGVLPKCNDGLQIAGPARVNESKQIADYQIVLNELAYKPKINEDVRALLKRISPKLTSAVKNLSDSVVQQRAQIFADKMISQRGYLPGLEPKSKFKTVAQLIEQCKKMRKLDGTELDNVVRNLRVSESTQEFIMQPDVSQSELLEAYHEWTERAEAAEVFKELEVRIARDFPKP
mgnify:CR=1 FL=1